MECEPQKTEPWSLAVRGHGHNRVRTENCPFSPIVQASEGWPEHRVCADARMEIDARDTSWFLCPDKSPLRKQGDCG